jgi:hypothetical protein
MTTTWTPKEPEAIFGRATAEARPAHSLGATRQPSPAYSAARHILESPMIAARTRPYMRDGDFDWFGLLAATETMSGGERLLVDTAHDLWEGRGEVDVWGISKRLGPSNFERVVLALRISRGEVLPEAA